MKSINPKISLHNHTFSSKRDGLQSFFEVIKRAKKAGIRVISVTDHETLDGYEELRRQLQEKIKEIEGNEQELEKLLKDIDSVHIISGIELKTSWLENTIEILGYNIDIETMKKELERIRFGLPDMEELWYNALLRIIQEQELDCPADFFSEEMTKSGQSSIRIFYEKVVKNKKNSEKPLMRNNSQNSVLGKIKSINEFVVQYVFNPMSNYFVDLSSAYPKMEMIIEAIHNSGGLAFLAHPGRYKFNIKRKIERILDEYNLDGIEVWHPDNNSEMTEFLLETVRKRKLKASGGSDDHKDFSKGEQYDLSRFKVPLTPETMWVFDIVYNRREGIQNTALKPLIKEIKEELYK